MKNLLIKRVYDAPAAEDGVRILVDRLWPRGLRKDAAQIDFWWKDVAPTPELRKWFGHDPALFPEFRLRYTAELRQSDSWPDYVRELKKLLAGSTVTLLYGARDTEHNHALVLQELFLEAIRQ